MTTWCRMRVNASLIFSAAALGAILLVSSAGAQEQWRTPTDYRSTQLRSNNNNYSQYRGYNDDRLIAPSARPAAVQPQSQPGWSNHSDRVARMESQMESLRTTRVAELEAEIVKMNERIVASGDMLQSMGGSYGACGGCGTGCCEPCCPPVQTGFYGGIEFLFLKPHFENSMSSITTGMRRHGSCWATQTIAVSESARGTSSTTTTRTGRLSMSFPALGTFKRRPSRRFSATVSSSSWTMLPLPSLLPSIAWNCRRGTLK